MLQKAIYVVETWQLFKTRKNERKVKVRLENENIRNGRFNAAEERMGKQDSRLARHSVDWDEAKIVSCEYEVWQREGIA